MAHVPLAPIGRPRDAFLDARTFEKSRAAMREKEDLLAARRAQVAAGWGPEYAERVHADGELTARERLGKLKDPGSAHFEGAATTIPLHLEWGATGTSAAGSSRSAKVHETG